MIAELMAQVCPSLSCTSLQRRSLISSTDQMEQPRISTSLLSPGLSSSPGGGGAEGEDHNAQLEMFHVCFPVGEKVPLSPFFSACISASE